MTGGTQCRFLTLTVGTITVQILSRDFGQFVQSLCTVAKREKELIGLDCIVSLF